MKITTRGKQIILSQPTTADEFQFMITVASLVKATGSKTVEFAVNSMGMNGRTTHVGLEITMPDGFEIDPFTNEVERVPTCCHICGGPDH